MLSKKKVSIKSNKIYMACFSILLLTLVPISCVERYYLDTQINSQNKIVVDALITDDSENQVIKLSKASLPEAYSLLPLSGCIVFVSDTIGHEFIFNENLNSPGVYEGVIDEEFLHNGNQLKLHFVSAEGEEYESVLESLSLCPQIDTVFYELQSLPTNDPETNENGIQFYIDFKASEEAGRYFRWQLDETWEYHSTWPIRDYIDENNVYQNSVADYSYFICYKTNAVAEVFILSTEGFTQNKYKKFPLHFVNDHTQRLMYQYSLLIKQYSLSKSVYNFWQNLKKNNQESGGFFDSQPALVRGNVYNIYNPKEEVLGYFGLSSIKTKRVNLKNITDLSFSSVNPCTPIKPEGPLPQYRPLYFVINSEYGESECFDCRLKGGTTTKPDYWEK